MHLGSSQPCTQEEKERCCRGYEPLRFRRGLASRDLGNVIRLFSRKRSMFIVDLKTWRGFVVTIGDVLFLSSAA